MSRGREETIWPEGYRLSKTGLPAFSKGRLIQFLSIKKHFKDTTRITLAGKTETGKTVLTTHILREKDFNRIFAIVLSGALHESYGQILPRSVLFAHWDDKFISNLLAKQSIRSHEIESHVMKYACQLEAKGRVFDRMKLAQLEERLNREARQYNWSLEHFQAKRDEYMKEEQNAVLDRRFLRRQALKDYRAMLRRPFIVAAVFDDVSSHPEVMKSTSYRTCGDAGRHGMLFQITCVQDFMSVDPKVRGSIDWVGVTWEGSEICQKKLIKYYLSQSLANYHELAELLTYVNNVNQKLKYGRYVLFFHGMCRTQDRWDSVYICYTPDFDPFTLERPLGDEILVWLSDVMLVEEKFRNIQSLAAEEGAELVKKGRGRGRTSKPNTKPRSRASASSLIQEEEEIPH
jgi:hypothetical protein